MSSISSLTAGNNQGGMRRLMKELHIDHPKNDFQIRAYPAEIQVRKEDPELSIDMQPVWDSMGLKNPLSQVVEKAAKLKWTTYEAIAQTARDGDRVANISRKEKNPFGNIGVERFFRHNQLNTNVGLMPEVPPDIHFQIYPLEIQVDVRTPETEAQYNRPKVRLVPPQSIPSVINMQV